ncbi:hypothetical protein [Fischerella sp. PCC 9605]|uniref:hypothetical protein n=1 Tax=Fischerella sp. PCC 9605 TaxID=1173024 RepID=UPI0004799B60|nr:hypothetical protein [Fischerella sp. PCC 9605]
MVVDIGLGGSHGLIYLFIYIGGDYGDISWSYWSGMKKNESRWTLDSLGSPHVATIDGSHIGKLVVMN